MTISGEFPAEGWGEAHIQHCEERLQAHVKAYQAKGFDPQDSDIYWQEHDGHDHGNGLAAQICQYIISKLGHFSEC